MATPRVTSPLAKEQPLAGTYSSAMNYRNQPRNNSVTSLSTMNSTSNASIRSSTSSVHNIPRGASTSDLFAIDNRFSRPSRPKVPYPQQQQRPYQPRLSASYSSPSILADRAPRRHSLQQYPNNYRHTQQRGGHTGNHSLTNGSMRPPKISSSRPRDPRQHSNYNHYTGGTSLPQQKQQRQHPQRYQQQKHAQTPIPTSTQRLPHSKSSSFTFPNGEIYTPRNKQRSSQTSLPKLQHSASAPKLSSQYQAASTSSSVQSSPNLQVPAQGHISIQQQQQHQRNTLSIPSSSTVPSIQRLAPQTVEPDLSLLTIGANSYSSSPSPSRTSRTNSSVNESTPPSSIDDLTIPHMNLQEATLGQSTSPELMLNGTHNLNKIEEYATQETQTALSTPASSSTEKVLMDSPTFSEETVGKIEQNTSTNTRTQPVCDEVNTISNSSKPSATARPLSHSKSTPALNLERKPSVIKRFFSKVFSPMKRSKSRQSRPVVESPTFVRHEVDTIPEDRIIKENLPAADSKTDNIQSPEEATISGGALEKPSKLHKQASSTSDTFSFIDGDEDGGLNSKDINGNDEFRNDLVLDKLFSRLSGNSSSEEIYKKLQSSKEKSHSNLSINETGLSSRGLREDITSTANTIDCAKDSPNDESQDNELIQFEDSKFIEKLLEFGETSFPDLASNDLGKSQRKLMRSKSIERKKSIRSITPIKENKLQFEIPSSDDPIENDLDSAITQYIFTNVPKEPSNSIAPLGSVIKDSRGKITNDSANSTTAKKKVSFCNQIYVNETFSADVYDRQARSLSSYNLSPQMIRSIRYEMNEVKRHMTVHEKSRSNTHYFHG